MATLRECLAAIETLGQRLASVGDDIRAQVDERTVSVRLTDLDAIISGRLTSDGLIDVTDRVLPEPAQIRLTMSSDDLVALVDGNLDFARAWASGRIKLAASFRDLLRLRSMLG